MKSRNKKYLILAISLVVVIVVGVSIWLLHTRRVRNLENNYSIVTQLVENYSYAINNYNKNELLSITETNQSYFVDEMNYTELKEVREKLLVAILSKVTIELNSYENIEEYEKSELVAKLSYPNFEGIYNFVSENIDTIKDGYRSKAVIITEERNSYIDYLLGYLSDVISNTDEYTVEDFVVKFCRSEGNIQIAKETDIVLNRVLMDNDYFNKTLEVLSTVYPDEVLFDSDLLGAYDKESKNYPKSLGEGNKDNMAYAGKIVNTVYIENNEAYDVAIKVNKVYKGDSAVQFAIERHNDNRGILNSASMQLVVIDYSIYNLSKKELNISSNFGLSDSLGNFASSTGEIFGLVEQGNIKPNEVCRLETYFFTEDVSKKFLVWGRNFNRQYELVWFNGLQM